MLRGCDMPSTSGRTLAAAAGWVECSAVKRPLRCVRARAANKGGQQSMRNAQLYEIDAEGWGVDVGVSTPPAAPTPPNSSASASSTMKKKPGKASNRIPYVSTQTPQGALSLALLQASLLEAEAQQAEVSPEEVTALKQQMAQLGQDQAPPGSRSKLPAATLAAAQQQLALLKQQRQGGEGLPQLGGRSFDDEEEDEDEDGQGPEFVITLEADGGVSFKDFSSARNQGGQQQQAAQAASLDDEFDLGGWEQFGLEQEEEEQQQSPGQPPQGGRAAQQLALLQDLSGEDDWGLEGMGPNTRKSLIQEMTEQQQQRETSSSGGGQALWGGTGGVTGLDMEEQETLLRRYFRPDQVKRLMTQQREADEERSALKRQAAGDLPVDSRLHRQLRIISGSAAGRKLLSSRGSQTRPMMDKVRQAVFNSVLSRAGSVNVVPAGSRWLDLFAGTGSVGLEALSRGAAECHFVEMDAWVVRKVLGKNIEHCGFKSQAITHTSKAEDFLRRARQLPRFAGGAFDFISMCPPYLLVSYPELFELLEGSPLIGANTIVFVEYAKQLAHQVPSQLGPLELVRNKKYGRTYIAMYAAAEEGEGEEGGAAPDDEMSQVSSLLAA